MLVIGFLSSCATILTNSLRASLARVSSGKSCAFTMCRAGVLRKARDEVEVEQVERPFLRAFEDDDADHLIGAEQRTINCATQPGSVSS